MHAIARAALNRCKTAVELGCGFGVVLKQLTRKGIKVHGVDVFQPYLDYVHVVAPEATCECADALEWCKTQEEQSWDAVLLIDFLEHVPHDTGAEILDNAQRIASRSIIIETPKGFQRQAPEEAYHIGTAGVPDMLNPYQEHVCGWEVAELEAFGFRCVIARDRLALYDRIYATWNR